MFGQLNGRTGNAEEIAKRAGLIYGRVAGCVFSLEGAGSRFRQAQDSYNIAIGQLSQGSRNLLRQTEMLKTLGAKTTKSIGVEFDAEDDHPPLVEQIETVE
jgi:DNA recombination protein RmuC